MKPKAIILMGLAIACGLGASYMTSRLLAERSTPDEPEKVEILFATKNISVHTQLVKPEEYFEKRAVSKDLAPADAITDFEALKGKKLKMSRNKGESITAANLYDKGGIEIPEGFQAIGVPVNLQTTAHGLATLPGSRVDLHLTVRGQDVFGTKVYLLLENVLVLAADIRVTPEGDIAAPAQVVTFALKQEDILKANVAMDMGTIRLIMRKYDDKTQAKIRVFTGREIEKKDKDKEPEQPTAVAKNDPPRTEDPGVKPAVKPEMKQEVKPAVKPDPEPELPPAPRYTKHYYDIVNGSGTGPRTVERMYYYRSVEDGRVLTPDEVEAESPPAAAPQPPRPTPATPKKQQNGPRQNDAQ